LAHRADNLTAICKPIIYTKCGSLNISQPYGPSQPVTGIALPYLTFMNSTIFKDVMYLIQSPFTGRLLCRLQHIQKLVLFKIYINESYKKKLIFLIIWDIIFYIKKKSI
jgi:hypothetical protein